MITILTTILKALIATFHFIAICLSILLLGSLVIISFLLSKIFHAPFFSKIALKIAGAWGGWMAWKQKKLTPLRLEVEGAEILESLDKKCSYYVISNHRSWVDVVLTVILIHRNTSFIRFFIKSELMKIPFFNLVIWALDYPVVRRFSKAALQKNPSLKGADLKRTKDWASKLGTDPVTIGYFPEGTRANPQKLKHSSFEYLLNPKVGGIGAAIEILGPKVSNIVDLTFCYDPDCPFPSLWDYLSGRLKSVKVHVASRQIPEDFFHKPYGKHKQEYMHWIHGIWKEKETVLSSFYADSGQ